MTAPAPPTATCVWHPDRETGLRCSRCGRPACPECLTEASVGFQCRQCVADARGTQRVARTFAGSRLGEKPLVSYVLVGVNVLVFAITAFQARSVMEMGASHLFQSWILRPGRVANGEWWPLFTSGFLHIGIIHLVVNMFSLIMIGPTLEQIVGRVRFAVVYLLSLLGGSVAVFLLTGAVNGTAGASGAIFGLMGALVVTFKRARLDLRQLIVVLAINLWISFQFSGISWQGHVGGLVVGAAVAAAMVYPPARVRMAWQVGASVGVLVLLGALVAFRFGDVQPLECLWVNGQYACYGAPGS